jgi:hypothetical protein
MSWRVAHGIRLDRNLKLTLAERLVLTELAWHLRVKDHSVGCYPSVETLEVLTGLSRSGVKKTLRKLEEKGLVTVEYRAAQKHANLYYLPHADLWRSYSLAHKALSKASKNGTRSPSNPPPGHPVTPHPVTVWPPTRSPSDHKPGIEPGIDKPGIEPGIKRVASQAPPHVSLSEETALIEECWKIADAEEMEEKFVQAFIDQHQRDGWTIRGERIRDLESALLAFVDKLEGDRNGEPLGQPEVQPAGAPPKAPKSKLNFVEVEGQIHPLPLREKTSRKLIEKIEALINSYEDHSGHDIGDKFMDWLNSGNVAPISDLESFFESFWEKFP